MRKIFIATLLCVFGLCAPLLRAQVILSMTDTHIQPNEFTIVPIVVENYQQILSTQFSITWDTTILTYINTINYQLPDMGSSNFNAQNAAQGSLAFIWYDEAVSSGINLPNGQSLFSIVFKGRAQGISPIRFDTLPTDIEVSTIGATILPVITQNAQVTVGNVSTTEAALVVSSHDISLYQNEPNPFHENSVIRFSTTQAQLLTLRIMDSEGKIVWQESRRFAHGEHQLPIETQSLKKAGHYQYSLTNAQGNTLTKQFVFIQH